MEKHVYTHAHKSRRVHCTSTHCNAMCAVCVRVCMCELVCGLAISFKNENHLADGKAQKTLAKRNVCASSCLVCLCAIAP